MIADAAGLLPALNPGLIPLLGALLTPLLPRALRGGWLVILPLLALAQCLSLEPGTAGHFRLFGEVLTLTRVDALSRVFGTIFCFAALAGIVYALYRRDTVEHVAALSYAGSAIGAVFAGDLVSLFVFWELTAITSVFLIWARRDLGGFWVGMRYLAVQVVSGLLLLSGVIIHASDTGSLAFGSLQLAGPGPWLIFLGFGVKAAFPLLHSWLTDAYPEATVAGAVFLSAFTTKMAVYALARGFAGTELLVALGEIMVVFTLVYAVLENDLRRVLAYALVNQLGFMVIAAGLGGELAINGLAAHAVSHILYKSLLFMALGAVLLRTGTARATELGGLHRSMPWTAGFCVVGALGMSMPLFAGFASKSLILSAAAGAHDPLAWAVLMLGSAGIFLVSGVKVVYYAFFGADAGHRVAEAPRPMLTGMALAAAGLVVLGVRPETLYAALPHAMDYRLFTTAHVVTQLQLLGFVTLGFFLARRVGLWPEPAARLLLDSDCAYRRALPAATTWLLHHGGGLWRSAVDGVLGALGGVLRTMSRHHGPEGILARTWPTGSMVMWVAILLATYLILYYV